MTLGGGHTGPPWSAPALPVLWWRWLGPDRVSLGQGKQKYTLPLYRAMWAGSEAARALAMETFSATAAQLHVNVQNYVKKILGLEGAEKE